MLKNKIFEFYEKIVKQIRGTAIGAKFSPVLFMDDLEEKIKNAFEEEPMIWWRYIHNNFLFGKIENNIWKNFSID